MEGWRGVSFYLSAEQIKSLPLKKRKKKGKNSPQPFSWALAPPLEGLHDLTSDWTSQFLAPCLLRAPFIAANRISAPPPHGGRGVFVCV